MSTHQVAVYGTLKQGHGNHRLLSLSKFLGITETEEEWSMLHLGGFPGLIEGSSAVHIEVYEVNDETFSRLDMLEGYPSFYNRREIETKFGTAWVYYLDSPYNYHDRPVIEHGCWGE